MVNKKAEERETRMNPAAANRETRVPPREDPEDAAQEQEEAQAAVVESPKQEPVKKSRVTRAQIGSIPKPFTVADVRKYIDKHGLAAWLGLGGWHKRKAALEEMK